MVFCVVLLELKAWVRHRYLGCSWVGTGCTESSQLIAIFLGLPLFEYQLSWNLINAYQELNCFIFKYGASRIISDFSHPCSSCSYLSTHTIEHLGHMTWSGMHYCSAGTMRQTVAVCNDSALLPYWSLWKYIKSQKSLPWVVVGSTACSLSV